MGVTLSLKPDPGFGLREALEVLATMVMIQAIFYADLVTSQSLAWLQSSSRF